MRYSFSHQFVGDVVYGKFFNMKTLFFNKIRVFVFASFVVVTGFPASTFSEKIDPQKLLEVVDNNLWSDTKYIEGRLIIDNGRLKRVIEMVSWMQGVEHSYSYYKSPPRERGTKMLKIGSKLWVYTPRTDRKLLVAGHMLRQSMMGSDLSYEDMMEDKKLSRSYEATLEEVKSFRGVYCNILLLNAYDKTTTYQKRKLWVDSRRKVILRQELYAKSGLLIKNIEFYGYRSIGLRLFPEKMIFRDLLKNNTQTTYIFDEIKFDVKIPAKYFSQSILKK